MTSIGLSQDWALGSLRLTVGTGTTAEDVDALLAALPGLVQKARTLKGGRQVK